jgi:hypothetical protein
MKVSDFNGEWIVNTTVELSAILSRRNDGGYNSFWLTNEEKYPTISLLAKDGLAYMHFFPKDRHSGFRSVGSIVKPVNGMTAFRLDSPEEEQMITNDGIIPFYAALDAAKEFLETKAMPGCIPWFELQ